VRRALLPLLVVACLVAAGCGSNDSPTTKTASTAPLRKCGDALDGVTVTGPAGQEPNVKLDTPLSVKRSACHTLIAGTGDAAKDGDILLFGFTFLNGRTGKVYGSSYSVDDQPSVLLSDRLMRGVRMGLTGARAGGRVEVAIAPDDGFGPKGGDAANGLKEDDTLVFVADIAQVRHPLPRAKGTAVTPPAGLPAVTLGKTGKPSITPPKDTAPPAALVTQPLIDGAGPAITSGQTLTVNYVGVIWGTGVQFSSSWASEPTTFTLGKGEVIGGWDKGLVGQKLGSQVMLIIPPGDGYGAEGAPNVGIKGTDTLVFVVDILDVR
jgi:peptidylprolyl isomerase